MEEPISDHLSGNKQPMERKKNQPSLTKPACRSIRSDLFVYCSAVAILVGIQACIDPFSPPEINAPDSFLVVDGFLNTNGADTSRIRLNRTQNVNTAGAPAVEKRAVVMVVTESETSGYTFHESADGSYFLPPVSFPENETFTLHIQLSDGRTYASDPVPAVKSPPIDSVTYTVHNNEGVQVYVNTHDDSNRTRFYRWTFQETWAYNAALHSLLEVVEGEDGPEVVDRVTDIYTCWSSLSPTSINVSTTAKLSRDVVLLQPVTYVPAASNKLLVKYSILVNQYGLTREGYDYWNEMAKTTETTGSIFDPLPSRITGNIRSVTTPEEAVFGFFSAGESTSKRIFINERMGGFLACAHADTILKADVFSSPYLILHQFDPTFLNIEPPTHYIMGSDNCADCRVQGGTIKRPPFWE